MREIKRLISDNLSLNAMKDLAAYTRRLQSIQAFAQDQWFIHNHNNNRLI